MYFCVLLDVEIQVTFSLCMKISPAKSEPVIIIYRPIALRTKLIACNLTPDIISCTEKENDRQSERERVRVIIHQTLGFHHKPAL